MNVPCDMCGRRATRFFGKEGLAKFCKEHAEDWVTIIIEQRMQHVFAVERGKKRSKSKI